MTGNHFHELIEVPKREIWLERFAGAEGEERLFEHLRLLYSKEFIGLLRQEIGELRRLGMDALAVAKLEQLFDHAIRDAKAPGDLFLRAFAAVAGVDDA